MKEYKYLIAGFIAGLALIAGTAYAIPAIDRTTTILPFADNTYNIGADDTEYAYMFLEELKVTGNSSSTGTVYAGVGFDGIGAVDLDYGSADITDHTFTTDDMTFIIDGGITISTGDNITLGTTQWNSADEIDGTIIKDADYGDIVIDAAGDWQIDAAVILEADLDADEAPANNDILTFDDTGDNFSWQTPAELGISGSSGEAAWEMYNDDLAWLTPTTTDAGIYLTGSVTTTANIYVTGGITITTSTIMFNEDLSSQCDGGTDAMTTAEPFTVSSLQVYWNNKRLDYNDDDYTITDPSAGTFSLSLPDSYQCAATDSLQVDYVIYGF